MGFPDTGLLSPFVGFALVDIAGARIVLKAAVVWIEEVPVVGREGTGQMVAVVGRVVLLAEALVAG